MPTEVPYQSLPIDQTEVRYAHGPDSQRLPGVPEGTTIEFQYDSSSIYPGTSRRFWVHVPSACIPTKPSHLMVFQDGWWYLDPEGEIRGGIVLDNLVHTDQIPPTIGVFVDPGVLVGTREPKNRNTEYDAFDDRYVQFLTSEILPEVQKHYALSDDPEERGICGGSSGGNCAFTAAWLRPEAFGRVIGFLSSFAQMPGGNPYPELISTSPRKPLRIFLQAGHRDIGWNKPEYNWFTENLRTAAGLAQSGYDMRLVVGDGGHSPNHGGVLLPDALRWIFRPNGVP